MNGLVVIIGSGELGPSMVSTLRKTAEQVGPRRTVALDSSYGFQENADWLTAKIVDHLRTSVGLTVEVPALRTPHASDLERERMLAAVRGADFVFAGPGSPTYALRVWQQIDLEDALWSVLQRGGAVVMASACAVTLGAYALPVYEIYKAGFDPYWVPGLNLVWRLGLEAAIVPHWNNAEGGNHDTSRCWIGERRMRALESTLPDSALVLGVDEHTGVTITEGRLEVSGLGTATVRGTGGNTSVPVGGSLRLDEARKLASGHRPAPTSPAVRDFPATEVGFAEALERGDAEGATAALLAAEGSGNRALTRSLIVRLGALAERGLNDPRLDGLVELALELRDQARREGRYPESDEIRRRLVDVGVRVADAPDGTTWELISEDRHS